ncbi:taurine ABC transporter substrate-binding protein [Azospirillum sp. RWY-5-1]|uniref:Taurine ABC transporter substrate-binding protein n=1 Tax=Azospirillum oleiclasticum TaxID=2735135 RepID=A0ABX2T2F5_9PROT|nr:taurine ABC transporter substrate-binding protein [Azospirillum oleiclasticum]NYZ11334.1 taurine ABC transporter substrate-binding protein [Azospirillum oleiclasticum]NYZ18495.1 taurine ABC transporter substrate-binding protein [Azospirillum oleiclasticum]
MTWNLKWLAAGLSFAVLAPFAANAQTKEITIAYQDMIVPWRVAMANQDLEKATGWKINWRQFGGGGDVVKAMASGDVAIGEAGSSPIAAALSQGVEVELFWILDDIGDAEALVVRNGSGIDKPADLKGKKLATPFVSTSHYHLMFALSEFGFKAGDVQVLNMRPAEIAAAWQRGDIDGAFIWDPALSQAKQNGKVLVSSGGLSDKGRPTFDGLIVQKSFAKANPEFMTKFVQTIAAADEKYRQNKAAWTTGSAEVAAVAKLTGAKPEMVPDALALYRFLPPDVQASERWLGGGKNSGAAKALADTAEFLKEQKRVSNVLPDYSVGVNPTFAAAAAKK